MPPAEKTKVLIAVKTYPSLSRKYGELVCTAGFREDGSWIRIYPIPFRDLPYENRFKKFNWIEVELAKNSSDFRPESHKVLNFERIQIVGEMPTHKDWRERRQFVLQNVKTNMSELIKEAHDRSRHTSLATFKPTRILKFVHKRIPTEWNPDALEQFKQQDLFRAYGSVSDLAEKIPWRFSVQFEDDQGKKRHLMLEDWETIQLYRNLLQTGRTEEAAAQEVCQHYLKLSQTKDLHLFLGTTLQHHNRSRNPFIAIGVFYPPHPKLDLFDA